MNVKDASIFCMYFSGTIILSWFKFSIWEYIEDHLHATFILKTFLMVAMVSLICAFKKFKWNNGIYICLALQSLYIPFSIFEMRVRSIKNFSHLF